MLWLAAGAGPVTQVGCWVGRKGCRSASGWAKLGALESAVEKGQPHSEGPGNLKILTGAELGFGQ